MKEGRWKGAGLGDYYCSLCGYVVGRSRRGLVCPECGASMEDDFSEDNEFFEDWEEIGKEIMSKVFGKEDDFSEDNEFFEDWEEIGKEIMSKVFGKG